MEIHPRVKDMQLPRLGKPRRWLQIEWISLSLYNVVVDSINSLIILFSETECIYKVQILSKQRHDAVTAYVSCTGHKSTTVQNA